MSRSTVFRRVGFAIATAWCLLPSSAMRAKAQVPPPPAADNPPPPPAADAGADATGNPAAGDAGEVLTRGPVHEAFAQPLQGEPTNALIVPRQPPEPIEEEPPAAKPDGENVLWISGYWAWDDDRKDFLWVSGVWRDAPPGQVWVAGYWNAVEGGYQWTSGFWTPASQQNVSYLPAPPASLDNGPNAEPPSESDVWIPGNFMYRETRYIWRPGFWSRRRRIGFGFRHVLSGPGRLCVYRWFLGLSAGPPGRDVRARFISRRRSIAGRGFATARRS